MTITITGFSQKLFAGKFYFQPSQQWRSTVSLTLQSQHINKQILQTNLHTFSYRISGENLMKDQSISFCKLITLLILMTLIALDDVQILLEKIPGPLFHTFSKSKEIILKKNCVDVLSHADIFYFLCCTWKSHFSTCLHAVCMQPRAFLVLCQKTFIVIGPKIFNSLSREIQNSERTSLFGNRRKKIPSFLVKYTHW